MTGNPSDLPFIELSYWDLLGAASLIFINGAVSMLLKLRLERRLMIAAVRTVVQLLLIGVALEWVFLHGHWLTVVLLMAVMSLIAGISAVNRTERRFPGIWLNSIVAVTSSGWLITGIALVGIVRPDHWYRPQYAIPLMGMILGNTLNGISLGLDRLTAELATRRDHVEMLLTLGATRWEAAREAIQQAVRTGMIPMINSMMVVGLVSLPGMMTGQLLTGAAPLHAVKYQIVIMFLIASATALGTCAAILSSYLRLFNTRHQFLYGRITEKIDR